MPAPTRPNAAPAKDEEDGTVVKIFDALRARIVAGDIAPGSVINSVDIAQRFGTSRTPVREALMMLNQYGLITMSARHRPRVAEVSAKAIRDLYALRTALHATIADGIVRQAEDADLLALQNRAAQLIAQFDATQTEQHLLEVEGYLAEEARLSDNQAVLDVLAALRWKIAWYRRLGTMSREQLKVLAHDRLRVAQAYRDRDARLAEAMNRSMLSKAGDYCEQSFVRATTHGG